MRPTIPLLWTTSSASPDARWPLGTDPLGRIDTYAYDAAGNLTTATDRRGAVTTVTYGGLNRPVTVAVSAPWDPTLNRSISYTYDALDRLTQAIDSASGTITRAYNDVARTVTETSPEGSVTWAADAAGRHAANRRTSKTLPNGIVATYTYDEASLLTGITYRQGATVLGTLWACGADLGGPILPPSLHCDLNL